MAFRVRIWSKPDTQTFIKRLREAGYNVNKNPSGIYEAWHYEGLDGGDALVFTAMVGGRGYLCRINDAYIKEDTSVQGDVKREVKTREEADKERSHA